MSEIIIYTNEQCPYCKQVKEELSKNNIKFKERLTKDWMEKWQDVTNLTGMSTVPTICFEDNYLTPARDFGNPSHLVSILNNFKKSKFSIEQQSLEKIKTLNYNISMAFTRLDKTLRDIENKLK